MTNTRPILERLEDQHYHAIGSYGRSICGGCQTGWPCAAAEAAKELRRMEAESDESHALIVKQSDLLTATVNALRGEPDELTLWSHHDVAELARALVDEVQRLRAASSPNNESD